MYAARRSDPLGPAAGVALEGGWPEMEHAIAWDGPNRTDDGWQELRTGARVLLHLARLPRIDHGETAPVGLTQAGIAAALGSSRTAITQVLESLEDGGAVRSVRGHVQGRPRRVKVYQLTPSGDLLVRHILDTMGR